MDSEISYLTFHAGRPDPVPNGTHEVKLASAVSKKSKAGNDYILLTWEIISGPHSGNRVEDTCMRSHPDSDVVERHTRKLKFIMSILGHANDATDWVGKRLVIKTVTNPDQQGNQRTQIAAYAPHQAKAPLPDKEAPPPPPPKAEQRPKPQRIPGQKPWERRGNQ